MTDRLRHSLSRLERRTRRLLDELCTWTPEQLRFRPSPASWSALELIEHLILAERAVSEMMRSNISEERDVRMRDRFRSALVLGLMALPLRLKTSPSSPSPASLPLRLNVPDTVKQIMPSEMQPDLRSLRDSWSGDRCDLADFLGRLSTADRNLGVFRHPVGGWTTASGAMVFLRLHLWHHWYQFRRLRTTVRALQNATASQGLPRPFPQNSATRLLCDSRELR